MRKGVFAAELTKGGRVDASLVLRAELERQARWDNPDPVIRLAAEKALAGEPPKAREDDPAWWRRRADSPAATALEKNQYLARAEMLEYNRPRGYPAGRYAQ